LVAIPAAVLIALVFWSFGDRVLSVARLWANGAVERFALSVTMSLGAVTLLVFLLAVLKGVSFASCAGLVLAMAALSWAQLRTNTALLVRGIRDIRWRSILWPASDRQSWAVWLSGVIVLLGLVQALAPVTGLDTGRMHFAAVKIMLREHGLSADPSAWFHRTGGFYMVHLFGMALGGEALARLLAFGVSPLALLLAAATSERLRSGTGRTAVGVIALTPIFTGFTGYQYLDLPVLMYLLAALLSFQRYRTEGGLGWAMISAAMAGFALGIKVSAFPVLVFLVPLVMTTLRREGPGAWKGIAGGVVSFGIPAGFWPIWNWATIGTFVYGYLDHNRDDALPTPDLSNWVPQVFLALGSIVTTSEYWIDSVGPLIIACLVGVTLFRAPSESRLPCFLALGAVAFYIAMLILKMRAYLWIDSHARYLGPALLAYGTLASAPFLAWSQRSRWMGGVLALGLLLPAVPLIAIKSVKAAVAAPAALGLESRSRYLAKKIETYEACEILNGLPEREVKVLFIAHRPYYLDRDMVPQSFWDGVRNGSDLARRAREWGVTHVLVEPEASILIWLSDIDSVFGKPPFREIRRWPWKQRDWVRLYAVERP